jgi:hypothetical protein
MRQLTLILTFLCSSCSLLNSGSANLKYTVSRATIDGIQYENSDRLNQGSVSIKNVQHPAKYDRWNFNVGAKPSVHLDREIYGTLETRTDIAGNVSYYPDLTITRLMGFGNLTLTQHTPAGQIALNLGFGGSLYRMTNHEGLETHKTREIRRIDLAWIAFFKDRFYIQLGPRYYREAYESYVFAFRIGYFWGAI